jgi:methylation protein EvaC
MIKKFLDLGMQPLANKYLTKKDIIKKNKEQFYHLEVGFDSKTKLVSIINTVPSKKMFNANYPYKSSMSQTMILSFKKLAKNLIKTYNPNSILEIGSNDGPLIRNFSKKKVICVEPCKNLAKITKRMGYKTYASFWNMRLAKKIKSETEKAELIYSANTLSHISNLNSVFRSIAYILSDDGILIIEEPSLLECLQKISYDQFYNEHIYVFSLLSINNLIKKYGLKVFNIERLNTHGGSLRYYIKKVSNNKFKIHKRVKTHLNRELRYGINKYSTYIKFKNKVESSKKKLKQIFLKLKKKNKKIIGYGATAKSSTVLNYCNIKNETLEYFLDTTPNKIGKYMPGIHIYIKNYNKTLLNKVDYVFLGAWNFKEEIFKKEKRYIEGGGKFITHVPLPRII